MGIKDFEVIVSNVDETLEKGLNIEEQSKKLAYIKAKPVFEQTKEYKDRIVIGSDTMVVKDDLILGKPHSKEEAIDMINKIQNDKHQVITSLCILVEKDGKYYEYLECDISNVYIKKISNKEIEEWIDSGEAYDKAGAYGIQTEFGKYVSKIDGNYFSIVGLPIHLIDNIIKKYI